MALIREYCDPDEIYLVRACSGALKLEGRSPYHPVKLLYLVRRAMDAGLGEGSQGKGSILIQRLSARDTRHIRHSGQAQERLGDRVSMRGPVSYTHLTLPTNREV